MASRFALAPVPRWRFGEDYLALLDSLEAALPLARASRLSDETIACAILTLSEGLIGEIVGIVTRAATEAVRSGVEQIMSGVDRGACACPAFAPARLAAARGSVVMRSTDPALRAIEVQPRYRDFLSGYWPVVANPEPDELLSSWLHRLAFGNGLPPRTFGPALDLVPAPGPAGSISRCRRSCGIGSSAARAWLPEPSTA